MACPAPNTYRGSSPTAAEALAKCGAVAGCLLRPRNDTVPSYRPTQRVGFRLPEEPVQLVPGSGEGQHTSNASILSRVMGGARRRANQADGLPGRHPQPLRRARGTHGWCERLSIGLVPVAPVRRRADAAASESILVELVRVEDLSSLEHEVHRAGELGGQHREGLALAVLFLEPLVQLLGGRVTPQERGGSSPKAHLRWALPILAPACPSSLPLDSRPGLTSRQ